MMKTEKSKDLIIRADIPYHKQLEPMGNGQYTEVEVAYKDDIESLPSAHVKTDGDLISRQTAIDGVIKSCFGTSNVVIAEANAINYIKKIPSTHINTDGDLISRTDAVKAMQLCDVFTAYDSEWSCDVLAESVIEQTRDCLVQALKTLPSTSVETDAYERGRQEALAELMEYTYGMLDMEKFELQHKIKSMIADRKTEQTEREGE